MRLREGGGTRKTLVHKEKPDGTRELKHTIESLRNAPHGKTRQTGQRPKRRKRTDEGGMSRRRPEPQFKELPYEKFTDHPLLRAADDIGRAPLRRSLVDIISNRRDMIDPGAFAGEGDLERPAPAYRNTPGVPDGLGRAGSTSPVPVLGLNQMQRQWLEQQLYGGRFV